MVSCFDDRASFISSSGVGLGNSSTSRTTDVLNNYSDFRLREHTQGLYSKVDFEEPSQPAEEPQTSDKIDDPFGGPKLQTVADDDPGYIAFVVDMEKRSLQNEMKDRMELMMGMGHSDEQLPNTLFQFNQDLPNVLQDSVPEHLIYVENSSQSHPNNEESGDQYSIQGRLNNYDASNGVPLRKVDIGIKATSGSMKDRLIIRPTYIEDGINMVSNFPEDRLISRSQNAEEDFEQVAKVENEPRNVETIQNETETVLPVEAEYQVRPKYNSGWVTGLEEIPEGRPKKLGQGGNGMSTLAEITRQVDLVTSNAKQFKYMLDTRRYTWARKNPDFVVAFRHLVEGKMRPFMLELTTETVDNWRMFRGISKELVGEVYDKVIS